MLPVVWSEKALEDLDGIVAFIAPRDFNAAIRLQERIEQAVEPTASHPYMFRSGRVDGRARLSPIQTTLSSIVC